MRYYHGLIDTKLLKTSVSYEKLPNVFIIMILPYDPFDQNRMVYTIKNQCMEDNAVSYDDGAVKLFLYTKGTEGNPSQDLIDMLKYIEESTADHIMNQDIKRVDDMVCQIKHSEEVGIEYMKSWEWEKIITENATARGMEKGIAQGIEQATVKIILNMYKNHYPLEQIALATEKTIEEIKAVIEQNDTVLV